MTNHEIPTSRDPESRPSIHTQAELQEINETFGPDAVIALKSIRRKSGVIYTVESSTNQDTDVRAGQNPSEHNSAANKVEISRLPVVEARNYIEEMLAENNVDALRASLDDVKSRYDSMRGTMGGEYEFQYYIYLIGELSKALGIKPDFS